MPPVPLPLLDVKTFKRISTRPRSHKEDLSRNYQAQIRDPLWFLARQWQMGEFQGEDAGSPYWVRFKANFSEVHSIAGTGITSEEYTTWKDPLVKSIERKSVLRDNFNFRTKIGQRFEVFLNRSFEEGNIIEELLAAYRSLFKIPVLPELKLVETIGPISGELMEELDGSRFPLSIRLLVEEDVPLGDDLLIEKSLTEEETWGIYDAENQNTLVVKRDPRFETEFMVYRAVIQDKQTFHRLRVLSGRIPDGLALLRAIRDPDSNWQEMINQQLPNPLTRENLQILDSLHDQLESWVLATFGEISASDNPEFWVPDQLEYQAQLFGQLPNSGEQVAWEIYPGLEGELDWYSFDQRRLPQPPGAPVQRDKEQVIKDMYPAQVNFMGMPDKRWWKFENRLVDFGSLRIDADELDKIAFTSFLMEYSNDWYVVPFTQKAGTIGQVEYLIVCDVFGGKTLVERADKDEDDPWTLFSNTMMEEGKTGDYFFLPPAAQSFITDSDPIEEIHFTRDEMANMVWGIENIIEDGLGKGHPGREWVNAGKLPDVQPHDLSIAPLKYYLSTGAPENWIPFLPVQIKGEGERRDVMLKKGAMLSEMLNVYGERQKILARNSLLNPFGADKPYRLREEEVPRVGKKVSKVIRRSRWMDGSTHVWIGNKVRAGRGESSSGLMFDLVEKKVPVSLDEVIDPRLGFSSVLDNFERPQNSQIYTCNTWEMPSGQPPLTYPVELAGSSPANRLCWIDYQSDINTEAILDSGRPIIMHRRMNYFCGTNQPEGVLTQASLDYLECDGDNCEVHLKTEGKVSMHRLVMRYGLPEEEFFDLRRFKGIRIKVKKNANHLNVYSAIYDNRNRYWSNTIANNGNPYILPAESAPVDIDLYFSTFASPHEHGPGDPLMNRIKSILIYFEGNNEEDHFVFEQIELF